MIAESQRVLFVCTHNSARSIIAEALLRRRGGDRFESHSAGTERSEVRPLTLRVLQEAHIPTEGLTSKSVDTFADQRFDYVVTVCDESREVCPLFPGGGEHRHWSHDDPSLVVGTEAEQLAAFRAVYDAIGQRIDAFIAEATR